MHTPTNPLAPTLTGELSEAAERAVRHQRSTGELSPYATPDLVAVRREAGFDEAELGQLSEHLLRVIQSFVIDPGRPPRAGDELRTYLRRWVGNAVSTR